MTELDAIRKTVHQNNINRYRRLLRTKLTDLERQYVQRRLAEERQALDLLMARYQRRPTQPRANASTVIAAASLARDAGSSRSTN